MKVIIKSLLDELIDLRIDYSHSSINYNLFKETNKNLGLTDSKIVKLKLLIRDILNWHKDIIRIASGEEHDYQIKVSDIRLEDFKVFFKTCPELSLLFKMNDNVITYADSLTSEEIEEIRQYFLDHLEITIRTTRYLK